MSNKTDIKSKDSFYDKEYDEGKPVYLKEFCSLDEDRKRVVFLTIFFAVDPYLGKEWLEEKHVSVRRHDM